jgi:hypothetical protein
LPAAEEMQVQVIDALAAIRTAVDHDTVAASQTQFAG